MKTFIQILLLSCFLIGTTAHAQHAYYYGQEEVSVTFGLRAGMSMSGKYGEGSSGGSKSGLDIGMTVDFRLSNKVYLLTGLDYVQKGAKTKKGTEWTNSNEKGEYKGSMSETPYYLQLPLRVGYKIPVSEVFIMPYAGPYIAYGLGGKTKYTYVYTANGEKDTEKRPTFDGNVNRIDYGLGLGVNAEYKKMVLAFEHDWGLQRFAKKSAGYNALKNKCFTITLGYKF